MSERERASSTASAPSSDGDVEASESSNPRPKVTRKRFNDRQVLNLEDLYRRSSHPSREEREALAKELDMEAKQVTIWFQNRRQAERKASRAAPGTPRHLHAFGVSDIDFGSDGPPSSPYSTASVTQFESARRSVPMSSPFAGALNPFAPGPLALKPTMSFTTAPTARERENKHLRAKSLSRTYSSPLPQFSLDTLASRSELRTQTPRRKANASQGENSLWDNMPSSPLGENSPRARETGLVEFGRRGTLEWACAQARVSRRGTPSGSDHGDEDDALGTKRKRAAPFGLVRKKAKSFSAGSDDPFNLAVRHHEKLKLARERRIGKKEDAEPVKDGEKELIGKRGESKAGKHKYAPDAESDTNAGEETEEEEHEAITPAASLAAGDAFWAAPRGVKDKGPVSILRAREDKASADKAAEDSKPVREPDAELMSAALVLCGLNRRS